jgi:prolyl oligopeptidase
MASLFGMKVIEEAENNISSVNIINNNFVINYMVDTFSEIVFYSLDGVLLKKLNVFKEASISGFGGDIDDTDSFLSVTSFVKPREIHKINLETLETFIILERGSKNLF